MVVMVKDQELEKNVNKKKDRNNKKRKKNKEYNKKNKNDKR